MEILGKPNQTLHGHIRDCLTVCDEIIARREPLLHQFCRRYGWNWKKVHQALRFAVWCHDIGKASDEWQAYIRSNRGRITHALPSFGIGLKVSNLPRSFECSPCYAALLAVLAHHGQLHRYAFREDNFRWQSVTLPIDYINGHFNQFSDFEPDFRTSTWQLAELQLRTVCKAIDRLKLQLKKAELPFKVLYSLILNVLTASDGYASGRVPQSGTLETPHEASLACEELASIKNQFPLYDNAPLSVLPFIPAEGKPNGMQHEIVQHDSTRVILNAGCGEGKTAAAMLFAQKLLKENQIDRIIFTLPTKFTANNLYRDLTDQKKYAIPTDIVGITHGDAREFLRQLAQENNEDEAENLIAQVFENNMYAKPVTISTVDHLIMSLYHGYKFADRAFSNVASSLVVFDEIHYYEQHTMGAIAEAMLQLTKMGIPHLVMTATIPRIIHRALDKLVPGHPYTFQRAPAVITDTSDPKIPFEIEKLRETFIHEEDKTVSPELCELVEKHIDQRQIIFVNQVARAKSIYQTLKAIGIDENVICYHSGFISKHRNEKERIIRSLFKKPQERHADEVSSLEKRGFTNSRPCILVSTQVSELSLDISADVMYSEIAPIDSIVQRGGRLNRKGESPHCEDHVYRMYIAPPYGSEKACLPYDLEVLQRSWSILGQRYTFQDACDWVNAVYTQYAELMHTELSKAIKTDLICGKKPQDNYGTDVTQEGHVVIRLQKYQTYDVVPHKFVESVKQDYQNYKTHYLTISDRVFGIAVREKRIKPYEALQKLTSRHKKTYPFEFKVIQARYTFDVGLELDE